MVVHRLLEIVGPDNLYLGQKDYQQCLVLRRLIEIISLDRKPALTICPIIREPGGLAMSSRNRRLNESQRSMALQIYQSLVRMLADLAPGDLRPVKERSRAFLENAGLRVDYAEIADAATLETVDDWDGQKKLVALIAAFAGDVRLIDNFIQ
jgi:pantoate--beta-alanine ligase